MQFWNVYLIPLVAVLAVCALIWYFKRMVTSSIDKHPMLCDVNFKNLAYNSPSRLRLQRAADLFDGGWKQLKGQTPIQALEWFAKAVEIDELACGWKSGFESKMEAIGDLFTLPSNSDEDKYYSMMAEAYFIVLLYTVVALYGKPQEDVAEDLNVVKTRMAVCAKLQPNNPAVYKLRADWMSKFADLADKAAIMADYEKAISLLEASKTKEGDDHGLALHGLDLEVQRNYLLADCHYQLARILHRNKKLKEAREHYQKSVEYADEDFCHLPDACFSLCVIHLLSASKLDDPSDVILDAVKCYRMGLSAEKRVLKYLPVSSGELSRKLAKHLIKKHTSLFHARNPKDA